ncbi:hypothetical protein [Geosporobacter ferrireducens]|uniref:D-glucuronyl C5-epimerase C-terminal domain-containing protein n=1 Tax=Geosporobacter ferrireducens TaxID=1424294 RepID=A0A1D8GHM2_9FIRM|nr:hypothetical protein [Geosporobacter ferrireducens]AOT70399.1 hypothetical protein Gferi_12905 [Geosporobacter ferrireducens]MTI58160.1 hypothetical protein [Geosporobacter ferrireducens]
MQKIIGKKFWMIVVLFLSVNNSCGGALEIWGQDFIKSQSKQFQIIHVFQDAKPFAQAEEWTYGWDILQGKQQMGRLTMNQYRLKNGDLYYYLRYLPEQNSKHPLILSIPINLTDFTYRYVTYPLGYDFAKSQWSETMVGDKDTKLTKESMYIDDVAGSYYLSYIDVFELQDKSVKKERYDLGKALQISDESIFLEFPHIKGTSVEQWGVLSQERLVDWEDPMGTMHLRMADLNRVRKQGQEGIYYFTPSSYYPSSPTSFWFNPAHHIGELFIRTEGARFFDDFGLVSLYKAVRSQNQKGYWWSTPRSNWLMEDYGIDSSFYDTRFSTDAAIFLLKGYDKYQDPVFLDAGKKYGDFLLQFAEDHHYETENQGWLVMDYGHDLRPEVKTHVSLNHLLTEMNFLYHLYILTEDEAYYALARKIKQGVKDTSIHWIKENGDLWYAYMMDGTYGKLDYPVLTLNDLRISQQFFEKLEGERDDDFEMLIQSKENYLKDNNLSLW